MTRRRSRSLTPQQLTMIRAQRAAQSALGEKCELVAWTPWSLMFIGKQSRRGVHVWTLASEYRVEVSSEPPAVTPPNGPETATRRTAAAQSPQPLTREYRPQ